MELIERMEKERLNFLEQYDEELSKIGKPVSVEIPKIPVDTDEIVEKDAKEREENEPEPTQSCLEDLDDFLDTIDDNVNSLRSTTIFGKLLFMEEKLLDNSIELTDKIKILKFLCDTTYGYFEIPEDLEKILEDTFYNIFQSDISFVKKGLLLHFKNEKILTKISLSVFRDKIKLDSLLYFQLLSYLLKSSFASQEEKKEVEKELLKIHNDTTNILTQMNIADIIINHSNKDVGNELLNSIRERERELENSRMKLVEENSRIIIKKTDREWYYKYYDSIYSDSQNVHNVSLNKSVMNAVISLVNIVEQEILEKNLRKVIEKIIEIEEVREELNTIRPDFKDLINDVIDRIQIDITRFDTSFSLRQVFSYLWFYIDNHASKEFLIDRLIEEFLEMDKYCSTGYITRLINVVQGFDDRIAIRVSKLDQIQAIVNHNLSKGLQNTEEKKRDEILDDMIHGDISSLIKKFVTVSLNETVENLLTDDKDEENETKRIIIQTVQKFIGKQDSVWGDFF
jgi:hypothetical protein